MMLNPPKRIWESGDSRSRRTVSRHKAGAAKGNRPSMINPMPIATANVLSQSIPDA